MNDSTNDQMCLSLLLSYSSENDGTYPLNIGSDFNNEQKNQMVAYLVHDFQHKILEKFNYEIILL